MEEIRLWIQTLGFPITVAVVLMYALYKMFMMREADRTRLEEALDKHAEKIAEVSTNANHALGLNTQATQSQTETIKKLLNADGKFCKAEPMQCLAPVQFGELIKVVKEMRDQGTEAAKLLSDKAILIATVEPKDGEHRVKDGSP